MDLMLYRNVATLMTTSCSFSGTMVKRDREMGTLEERRAEDTLVSVSLRVVLVHVRACGATYSFFFWRKAHSRAGVYVLFGCCCVCVCARARWCTQVRMCARMRVCWRSHVLSCVHAILRVHTCVIPDMIWENTKNSCHSLASSIIRFE